MTLVLNGTTGISSVDGSAATPAVQGNDTNTGVFFPAADTVALSTGGTERVRVDSSGNVGVGLSAAASRLDVKTTVADSSDIRLSYSSTDYLGLSAHSDGYQIGAYGSPVLRLATGGTERMRLDANGTVIIGATTNPNTRRLRVNGTGSGGTWISVTDNIQTSNEVLLGQAPASSLAYLISSAFGFAFSVNGYERMRILSDGGVAIGKTLASEAPSSGTGYGFGSPSVDPFFSVVNTNASGINACIYLSRRTTGVLQVFMSNNGSTNTQVGSISHNGTTTSYNTSSDYRLKEDIVPVADAAVRLMQLKPVNFAWKLNGTRTDGFLAHEAAEVVPEAVMGEKDAVDRDGNPDYQGIDQSKLVPLLTAALQEALTKISSLEARIAALEA